MLNRNNKMSRILLMQVHNDNRFTESKLVRRESIYSPFPSYGSSFLLPSFIVFYGVSWLTLTRSQSDLTFSVFFSPLHLSILDMSTRITRSMSASAEPAPMQSATTTRGRLRGGMKPTRGRKSAATARQLAQVSERKLDDAAGQLVSGGAGDMAVAAGQPVLVGIEATVGDGALAADREGAAGGSSNVALPQDVCYELFRNPIMRDCPKLTIRQGHQDQGTMVIGPGHPLPNVKKADRETQTISLPRPSDGWPLPRATFVLSLLAVLLAFLAPLAFSRHQSAKTASSLAEFGSELQRLTNQTNLLAGRVGQIEERAIASKTPVPSQINWLSWDLGARAMVQFSSPAITKPPLTLTAKAKPWWCPWCKERHIPTSSTWYAKRAFSGTGPNAALLPHTEYEEPYCTSAGAMLLAVELPRPIIPTELVIEHWRKDEVTVVGIAPRDVELWVRDGEKMVLAGKWIYNIHSYQEAQKFPVALADLAVQLVGIRVTSNWGSANRTCLVRAKLHGIDKSGIEEKLFE